MKSLRGQACDIAILTGQLVRVDEPDGSGSTGSLGSLTAPNQPTVYAYDALNNLLSVQQPPATRRKNAVVRPIVRRLARLFTILCRV